MKLHAVGSSVVLLLAGALSAFVPRSPEEKPWPEIVGPAQGELPQPQARVVWRDKLDAALVEARESRRPLFVTLRCLPCKQCMSFDQAVLEGGRELDPLLAQFITVRLTSARDLDLRLFPVEAWQDLDLSWWGWLFSPEGCIYAVFGGRDEKSDTTRISPTALANTLRRVLAHHYDPRRIKWDIDGAAPELTGTTSTPLALPGFAAWSKRSGEDVKKKDGCMHCHQIAEVLRQPALDAKTFDKTRDLDMWPFPENVGITVERDDGLLVTKIEPDSAAERAGIKAGDRLAVAGARKLFGQADLRAALHQGPRGAGTVELRWWRGAELQRGVLAVKDGWRKTALAWRTSVAGGNIGPGPGFAWPLVCKPERRRKLGIADGSMAVKPWFGKRDDWPARRAGLSEDDVIVAVGGKSPNVVEREFMTWFRLAHEHGDSVVVTARDAHGKDREVRYVLE